MIRGERLYLRSIERDDLQRCHDWMNDEELTRDAAQRYPMSLAREADWVERATRGQDPSQLTLAICLFQGDRHIGNCGLMASTATIPWRRSGIFIGETDCRGKGFGEEATRVLCRYAFDEMNLHKIRLDVYAGNAGAVRTYERVGFRKEGVLREETFRRGRYIDVMRMGLLRGELTDGDVKRRHRPGPRRVTMNAPEYRFRSQLAGSRDRRRGRRRSSPTSVELSRWWPSVYLDVEELEPGGEGGRRAPRPTAHEGLAAVRARLGAAVTESRHPHGF